MFLVGDRYVRPNSAVTTTMQTRVADTVEAELARTEETSKVDCTEFSQTLCTVLQVALINLLRRFGIKPSAVLGHSSGEIAAA